MKNCFVLVCLLLCLTNCTIKYSTVGVNIPAEAKTVAIKQFQNNAALVNLKLANELTTQLKDKFQSSTKLSIVNSRGDLSFDGEITNYSVTSAAVGTDMATMNRLTITVRITYENRFDEEKSTEKTFSRYVDFDSGLNLSAVEDQLVAELCEALVDDIFAATVGDW
ncbi:MAG: LptE family protein [Bacteroidales bacterium]|nr:LptE family protein [Bacteroidales bacterium]